MTGVRTLVLGYHRIGDADSDVWSLCVSPAHFAEHLRRVSVRGGASRLLDSLQPSEAGNRIVLTFDDGYAETLHIALPLLAHHGVPATFFLATGFIDSDTELWWDTLERVVLTPEAARDRHWRAWQVPRTEQERTYHRLWHELCRTRPAARDAFLAALCRDAGVPPAARRPYRVLTRHEIRAVTDQPLVEFGCHSVTHPVLSELDPIDQLREIRDSRDWFEQAGVPLSHVFAYPFGQRTHYDDTTIRLVREAGFVCACANHPGLLTGDGDRFRIPRVQVHDCDGPEFDRILDQWLGADA